jgi:hypothetical protein
MSRTNRLETMANAVDTPSMGWNRRGFAMAWALVAPAALVCAVQACGSTNVIDVVPSNDGEPSDRTSAGDARGRDATTHPHDAAAADSDASSDASADISVDSTADASEAAEDSSAKDVASDAPKVTCPPATDGGFVTVATAGGPWGIAVSPTDLFWAEVGGKVSRMSLADCSVTVLATGQNYAWSVTLAGSNVYWSNNSDGENAGSIVTMPQTGGTPMTLASGLNSPGDLTNDGTYLYWMPNSNDYPAVVSQMALTGGTVTSLGTGALGEDMVATGGWVYWTDYFAESILALPATGGAVATLASSLNVPWGIATDGTSIYWTEFLGADSGTVMSVPATAFDGGAVATLISGGVSQPEGIASDGVHVYFGTSGSSAESPMSVMKMNTDGSGLTVLVPGPTSVDRIVVDAKNVYWTDFFGGAVNMAPK